MFRISIFIRIQSSYLPFHGQITIFWKKSSPRFGLGSAIISNQDPVLQIFETLDPDPDPHEMDADPKPWFQVKQATRP